MIISGNFLRTSFDKYNQLKKIHQNNNYLKKSKDHNDLSLSFYKFILVLAIIFFIMELVLLYFAILIAINCAESDKERVLNFIMATMFTSPFILTKIVFDPCTKSYLKNGSIRIKSYN